MVEVHPVDPGEEGQRDEDRAHDREHLHDLVHAVAHRGHVGLGEARRHLAVGLDDVDRLHRVVVDVADVGAGDLREALVGLALHLAESTSRIGHSARRTRSSSRFTRWISWMVSGRRVLEDPVLQLLEAVAEQLQDREGLVHDRVDQRVREEARVVASQQRARRPDPLADRVPHVARGLLEGQHRPVADEDADLLRVQSCPSRSSSSRTMMNSRAWKPAVLLVGLHLGPLRHVEHVLDGQRVEVVLLGEGPDDAEVAEAVHVDPADGRPVGPVPGDEARQVLHLLGDGPAPASSRCR